MSDSKSQPVIRHWVRDHIENRIMAGELKPGTRLPQQKLARELGVNQGAVRESLFELRYAGLVEITDGLGAFVLNLDEERLIEALHIREALEGMAARICCETLNRRQLDELRELAAEVDHLGATGRIEEMCPRDEQFHSRIVELTEMPMLERLADSYRTLARIARMWPEGHILEPEHQNLLVPIQHNDPDEAERAMRQHVRSRLEFVRQRFAESAMDRTT